ncbi:hypothetical protein TNCV_3883681 [Trichonephila clavipes]|nr:hypothetical protein TNCV_3883681 [Trichonephila clavipes]
MNWRHRFSMLPINLSETEMGSEDQTRSNLCSSLFNALGEGKSSCRQISRRPESLSSVNLNFSNVNLKLQNSIAVSVSGNVLSFPT